MFGRDFPGVGTGGGTIILGAPSRLPRRIPFFLAENYSLIAEHQEREKDMLRADAAWRPFSEPKMGDLRWQIYFADDSQLKILQGPKKWFVNIFKKDPGRAQQQSQGTAGRNFTKPRTSHFFDLCIGRTGPRA